MTRKEAKEIIYEIINSGIIDSELEEDLVKVCNCICEDDFDECEEGCDTAYCEGCPFLKCEEEEEEDEDDYDIDEDI